MYVLCRYYTWVFDVTCESVYIYYERPGLVSTDTYLPIQRWKLFVVSLIKFFSLSLYMFLWDFLKNTKVKLFNNMQMLNKMRIQVNKPYSYILGNFRIYLLDLRLLSANHPTKSYISTWDIGNFLLILPIYCFYSFASITASNNLFPQRCLAVLHCCSPQCCKIWDVIVN